MFDEINVSKAIEIEGHLRLLMVILTKKNNEILAFLYDRVINKNRKETIVHFIKNL